MGQICLHRDQVAPTRHLCSIASMKEAENKESVNDCKTMTRMMRFMLPCICVCACVYDPYANACSTVPPQDIIWIYWFSTATRTNHWTLFAFPFSMSAIHCSWGDHVHWRNTCVPECLCVCGGGREEFGGSRVIGKAVDLGSRTRARLCGVKAATIRSIIPPRLQSQAVGANQRYFSVE